MYHIEHSATDVVRDLMSSVCDEESRRMSFSGEKHIALQLEAETEQKRTKQVIVEQQTRVNFDTDLSTRL